jgi:hypothetical protein
MKLRKTQVAAAVGGALLLVGTAVQAQTAPTVQVYGQVSRALMFADDGAQSKWFHVDAEPSGTRFGITGTGQALPTLRYGFRLEVDLQSNESQRVTFAPQSGGNGPQGSFSATDDETGGWAERHMDVWLEGGWGRVNIGQGDGAANGATESDLSGTGMANGIGVADLGGGINYRTTSTGGVAVTPSTISAVNVNGSINQQDFESRYDRLMYVTPTFGGFRGQVSWGQKAATGGGAPAVASTTTPVSGGTPTTGTITSGVPVTQSTDVKELSVWYGGKFGGFGELAAAAGWSERGANSLNGTRDEYIGGSVSWLHGSGVNATFSYSKRDQPLTAAQVTAGFSLESTFMYFKLGWKRGAHAIAVDYALGDDFSAKGDEAKMYGVGYVWNPVRWVELFAAYKVHQLDRAGSTNGTTVTAAATFDDVKIGTLGTRIRF